MMHSKTRVRTLIVGVASALAWGAIAPAFAEQGQLEEILVTATRREQKIDDVGIAVSALTGDTLTTMGVQRTEDLVATLPNIVMTSIFGPGTNPNWSIRGITSNDYNDATEAPIASYIDDVYLVSTGAGSTPFYDMNRVEVLRGPQGTLFGRNSTGGAVQFISNEPTKTASGSVLTAWGSYDTVRVQGFVNEPISDSVQFRLAGYYSQNQGFMHNVAVNDRILSPTQVGTFSSQQADGGQRLTQAVRAQLAFEPSDSIRDVIKFSYSNSNGHTSSIWHDRIATNPANGDEYAVPGPDGNGQPAQYGWTAYNGQDRELKAAESYLAINKLTWKVNDKMDVTSISAYNHYLRDVVEDCDGGAQWQCSTHYRNPSHQYSEEIRAFLNEGAQRYTLGAYGLYQFVGINHVAPLFVSNGGGGIALIVKGQQQASGEALFGNGEFDFGDQVTLITGLRLSQDKKHFQHRYSIGLPVDPNNPWPDYISTANVAYKSLILDNVFSDTTAPGLTRFTKNLWSGKVELDFKPVHGQLLYLSVSRGTKAPGYNNGFISGGLTPDLYKYDSEELNAYELGWKSSLADHRVQLNVDAYYYKYHNYDIQSYAGVGSIITNGEAMTYGAEFDLTAKPSEHWYMSLNGSAAHSVLYNAKDAAGFTADRLMPLAPKWTLSGRVGYEMPISAGKIAGVEVDGRSTSGIYNGPGNNSAEFIPGYTIFNARVFVADENRNWEASVGIRNLGNRLYSTQIFLLDGIGHSRYGFYGDPRWITAELRYNF